MVVKNIIQKKNWILIQNAYSVVNCKYNTNAIKYYNKNIHTIIIL